jgi:hypothetical protein
MPVRHRRGAGTQRRVEQRRRVLCGLAVVAFGVVGALGLAGGAAGAGPPHAPNLWAGDWKTSDGTVGWRLVRPSEVRDAAEITPGHEQLYDKLPCKEGPQIYEGGYVAGDAGKVIACGTPTEMEGRWLSDTNPNNHGSFTLTINSQNPLTFAGTAVEDGGTPFSWTGSWESDFPGDGAGRPFVVGFSVIATGKPNVTIAGAPNATLSSARLAGSGHVTLTENTGDLLEATETKGQVSLDETYANGRTVHLKLGVQSHSLYSPANNRLALILDVTSSNDPLCPAEGTRIATLTLLPGGGARDTAIFFGVPYSQTHTLTLPFLGKVQLTTNPCLGGHVHGWENGSGGVTVRVRLSANAGS